MAESDLHRDWMVCILERLKKHFTGQKVYVSGNLLIYYMEGNPKRCVAPDAFVVKDCDPGRRKVFKIWEEKRTPCFVLETTSASTQREDLEGKMELFARLGIAEYFLFDPRGEWLSPALVGFRLEDGEYEPMPRDVDGGIKSEELSLTFWLENGKLQIRNTVTGEKLTSGMEKAEQLREEASQYREEAGQLREENEALKARLAALEDKLRDQ